MMRSAIKTIAIVNLQANLKKRYNLGYLISIHGISSAFKFTSHPEKTQQVTKIS